MAYVTRTKDDPGDVGRAADQQQSIDNETYLKQAIEGVSYRLRREIFVKESIVDNVATEIFKITTVNETGDFDAGVYAVKLHGVIGHMDHTGLEDSPVVAAKGFGAQFCRVMRDTGIGAHSAVTENLETASAATGAATRDIGEVTLTLVETSEYITSVQLTIDLTGTSVGQAYVALMVEMIWYGFATMPSMSQ